MIPTAVQTRALIRATAVMMSMTGRGSLRSPGVREWCLVIVCLRSLWSVDRVMIVA